MRQIDESKLETDLLYRFEYLVEFIGFTQEDASAIQELGPQLGPLIPQIVDRTYERLLAYDATARHFVPKQAGFGGTPPTNIGDLSASHPQIQFRKEHLSRYLMQILGRTCDAKLVPYLDMVGKIHTKGAGNPEIVVPLVQMNALMGAFADIVTEQIGSLPIEAGTAMRSIRAFNKLLWIQNDFITRQYAKP